MLWNTYKRFAKWQFFCLQLYCKLYLKTVYLWSTFKWLLLKYPKPRSKSAFTPSNSLHECQNNTSKIVFLTPLNTTIMDYEKFFRWIILSKPEYSTFFTSGTFFFKDVTYFLYCSEKAFSLKIKRLTFFVLQNNLIVKRIIFLLLKLFPKKVCR